MDRGKAIWVGDFNIHVNDVTNPDTITFRDFLDSFNLKSMVSFLTHKSGHTIDLVLQDLDANIVEDTMRGFMLSDHNFIDCILNVEKPTRPTKMVSFRKLKSINQKAFKMDLSKALEVLDKQALDEKLTAYDNILQSVLDSHALLKTKMIRMNHNNTWFTNRVQTEKILRGKKERAWQQDPNPYSYQAFYNQCRYVNNLTNNVKRSLYQHKIQENKGDPKRIFGIINTLLHWDEVLPLPTLEDPKQLANDFNVFFKIKIDTMMENLRHSLEGLENSDYIEKIYQTNCRMEKFSRVDVDLIMKLVQKSASKSFSLDPIPTELLTLHIDVLATVLCDIVNTSLTNTEVSESLKEAKLRPLLKKISPDTTFKNYRPVSNLSFVLKLIQKVICEQLTRYTHSTGKNRTLCSQPTKWLTQLKQCYSGSSQISSRIWTKIKLHVLFFLT